MGEELKKLYYDANRLKNVLLENDNIGILLFLAKYNPKVKREQIKEKFGKEALQGLDELKRLELVIETEKGICLTPQGIFQVEGLIAIAV